MLTAEMIEESSFYQMVLEKGVEKGMSAGRVQEARRLLRLVLDQRFPGLEVPNAVEALNDPDRLEGLIKDLLAAPDAGSARSILQRL